MISKIEATFVPCVNKIFLDRLLYINKQNYSYRDCIVELFTSKNEDNQELSSYIFNENNWNSGQDIIKDIIMDIFKINGSSKYTQIKTDSFDIYYKFDRKKLSWRTTIIDTKTDNSDMYYICWNYPVEKIDIFTKNGKPINLKEYIDLINQLIKDQICRIYFIEERGIVI